MSRSLEDIQAALIAAYTHATFLASKHTEHNLSLVDLQRHHATTIKSLLLELDEAMAKQHHTVEGWALAAESPVPTAKQIFRTQSMTGKLDITDPDMSVGEPAAYNRYQKFTVAIMDALNRYFPQAVFDFMENSCVKYHPAYFTLPGLYFTPIGGTGPNTYLAKLVYDPYQSPGMRDMLEANKDNKVIQFVTDYSEETPPVTPPPVAETK